MILRLTELFTAEPVTIKRDKDTRKRWMTHYDSGHRIVTVSDPAGSGPAILRKRPVETGADLTLDLAPLLVVEVWGGVVGELSSLYIRTEGGCVYGERINGWKCHPVEPPKATFHPPSPIAAEISRKFILHSTQ